MERGVFDQGPKDVTFLNRAVAYCLYMTHMAVTFLVAFGWLSPWDSILWAVIIVYAITEILWATRDGYCILTDLERWFLGIEKPENALQQNFIKRLLIKLFGVDMSPAMSRKMTVIWGRFSFVVSSIRLASPGL